MRGERSELSGGRAESLISPPPSRTLSPPPSRTLSPPPSRTLSPPRTSVSRRWRSAAATLGAFAFLPLDLLPLTFFPPRCDATFSGEAAGPGRLPGLLGLAASRPLAAADSPPDRSPPPAAPSPDDRSSAPVRSSGLICFGIAFFAFAPRCDAPGRSEGGASFAACQPLKASRSGKPSPAATAALTPLSGLTTPSLPFFFLSLPLPPPRSLAPPAAGASSGCCCCWIGASNVASTVASNDDSAGGRASSTGSAEVLGGGPR